MSNVCHTKSAICRRLFGWWKSCIERIYQMVIGCQRMFCNYVKLTMKMANKMVTSSVCACVKSGQQVSLNAVFLHVVLNTICASCPSIQIFHWLSLSSSCFFCLQKEKLIKCQMHPSILSV